MHDLNDLYYFVQVVDHRGFAPASKATGEPKSKLSRRVTALEERLGVRLLQRSTRAFSVTDIGHAYYTRCKAMLVEAESAQEVIDSRRSEPCGTVRMTCPVSLLEAVVGDMLTDFLSAYPRVDLHLEATNRRVDVVSEGIDLAIRVRPPPLEDSDLVMRTLAQRKQHVLASPGLLETLGTPTLPTDLERFPSLGLGRPDRQHFWNMIGPDGETVRIEHQPRYITHSMSALAAAAAAGVGVVQLPDMMIRSRLDSGALVEVLPEWAPPAEIIHAVFPSRRGLLPSVRALVDFLAERFSVLEQE